MRSAASVTLQAWSSCIFLAHCNAFPLDEDGSVSAAVAGAVHCGLLFGRDSWSLRIRVPSGVGLHCVWLRVSGVLAFGRWLCWFFKVAREIAEVVIVFVDWLVFSFRKLRVWLSGGL